jgi:hypothetical protein
MNPEQNPQQGRNQNRPESLKNQAPKPALNRRNGHLAAQNPAPEDTALNPNNPLRQIIQSEALRALRPGGAAETVSCEISNHLWYAVLGRAQTLGIPHEQLLQAALLLGFEWLCVQDLFHHPFSVELPDPLPEIPEDRYEDWPNQTADDWNGILQEREKLARLMKMWSNSLQDMPYRTAINQIGNMYEMLRFNPHMRNIALALRFIHEAERWLGDFLHTLDSLDEHWQETLRVKTASDKAPASNESRLTGAGPSCTPIREALCVKEVML